MSRAAAKLCLSQPATSNALKRLRLLFRDPLLIQVGRGMCLSPRAQRLLPLLDEACVNIEALLQEAPFDPAETRRSFVIEAADYMELLLGVPLINILSKSAPLASVNFTHADGAFRDRLTTGAVDIAIIAWDRKSARGLSQLHGYYDRMVGVVRSDHPLARRPPATAAALSAYPQIGIEPQLRNRGASTAIDRAMRGLIGHQRLGAQSFMLLPLLAAKSDCVAIVPKVLADQVCEMTPLELFELPGDTIVIDAGILWSPIHESDPAHQWFRGIVDRVLRQYFADGASRRPSPRRKAPTRRRMPVN